MFRWYIYYYYYYINNLLFIGSCISLKNVCDKKKDCKEGDDEDGLCNQCKNYGCSDRCQEFPNGPKCTCSSNMFLSIDEKTCKYYKMCNVGSHKCSQHCIQIYDRVNCSCANGYTLTNQFVCQVNVEYQNGNLFVINVNFNYFLRKLNFVIYIFKQITAHVT